LDVIRFSWQTIKSNALNRIDQLLEYLAHDPDDPFNLYALALEYQKTDQQKALDLFEKLLAVHETYVPTYYHAGKLLIDMEEIDKAKAVLQKGIKVAEHQGDHKAVRELRNAFGEIEFD
jgi:tetratricopeptide (TPR) repeat protein